MNTYQNNTYMQNKVLNASPEQILLMLYDGAILFLRQAKLALEEDKKFVKIEKIGRAIAILTELSNTLDFENGGEFAENMDSLYWYMIRELTRANLNDDLARIVAVETMLVDLRESWATAIASNRPAAENTTNAYGGEGDAPDEVVKIYAAV